MSEQANDFLRDYQAFAQQSWDAWTRQFQPPGAAGATANPFVAPAAGAAPLQPILDGLAAYADWLRQGLRSVSGEGAGHDWQTQLEQWLALSSPTIGGSAPDPAAWWRSLFDDVATVPGAATLPPWFPAFNHGGERQARQRELVRASIDCAEAGKPYQAMLLRAHADAVALLRERLAGGELSLAKDDIKGLYTAWVEATEQAYGAISMTVEFRAAYAAMVNAQMRLHQLQRQQVEETCREWGMPTRAEFDELAQRMHELRRAWRTDRAGHTAPASARTDDVQASSARRSTQPMVKAAGTKTVAPATPNKATKSTRKTAAKSASEAVGKAAGKAANKPVVSRPAAAAPKPAKRR